MAARGWGGSVATAIGVAAGAGAAQLGLGYGLGIIAWQPTTGAGGESAWVASLAWATWIAATSAVAGAICADRLSPSAGSTLDSQPSAVVSVLWRVALALAAAVGALITVPLVAVPARVAVRADTFSPQTIAGGYAVVGVVVGLIVAIGALASRAIAANVISSVSWLWLLAVVAVVDGVAASRGLGTAQLGVWQFTSMGPVIRNVQVWQALLTLGAAVLIGALAALPAARRGDSGVGIAISGAVGPLIVAAAYFLAAPELIGIEPRELSAYLVAPYAVIAGLAGSVTVAGLAPRLERVGRGAPPDPVPVDAEPHQEPEPDASDGTPEATSTARGQASVAAPVWPEDAISGSAAGGGGRKGKGGRSSR